MAHRAKKPLPEVAFNTLSAPADSTKKLPKATKILIANIAIP
jgi:hypothetical protein